MKFWSLMHFLANVLALNSIPRNLNLFKGGSDFPRRLYLGIESSIYVIQMFGLQGASITLCFFLCFWENEKNLEMIQALEL